MRRIWSQRVVQCQCQASQWLRHDDHAFLLGFGWVADWRSNRQCPTASTHGTWFHCCERRCRRALPATAPSCTGLVRRKTWNGSCCCALCVHSQPQFQWERDRQCPKGWSKNISYKLSCLKAMTHQNGSRIGDYRFEELLQSVHWEKVAKSGKKLVVVLMVVSARHVPLVTRFTISRRSHDQTSQSRWYFPSLNQLVKHRHVHNHIIIRLDHVATVATMPPRPLELSYGLYRQVVVI